MPIRSFKNKETETIALGKRSKRALKLLPLELHHSAHMKLIFLDNIKTLVSLRAWPGLKVEKLSVDRKGAFSIRINDQFRICFRFDDGNSFDVEIVDYH